MLFSTFPLGRAKEPLFMALSAHGAISDMAEHLIFSVFLIISLVAAASIWTFAVAATMDPDEVSSLDFIAEKMGFPKWNFTEHPCTGEMATSDDASPYVACSCTSSTCHVIGLWLKRLNLVSEIPLEIGNFTKLQELSLSYNLLRGNLPIEIGRLQGLHFLDIGINELSGPLPWELGNLTNLKDMYMASNSFSGSLPVELGHLTLLSNWMIDANDFSGPIPKEIGEMTSLKLLWMFGNQFNGQIPVVFGNMSLLEEL